MIIFVCLTILVTVVGMQGQRRSHMIHRVSHNKKPLKTYALLECGHSRYRLLMSLMLWEKRVNQQLLKYLEVIACVSDKIYDDTFYVYSCFCLLSVIMMCKYHNYIRVNALFSY